MIRLVDVSKTYTLPGGVRVEALKDISLEIPRGEIFGIIGHSGAGKSTLIRLINLLERPTRGEVWVDGVEMTRLSEEELRRRRMKIGMIFQHFNLLWSRTVFGNVAFPLGIAGWPRGKARERVLELLELVGLSEHRDRYPSQLSGGQKQRVGIARALANAPDVLLSDEATSALDPNTTDAILELLKEINARFGLTIVLITHEMSVIEKVADRVAVLDHGVIQEVGEVAEVFARPRSPVTRALLREGIEGGALAAVDPNALRGPVVRLVFVGESANRPLLSALLRNFDLEVNILQGQVRRLKLGSYGVLYTEWIGREDEIARARDFLEREGVGVEVLDVRELQAAPREEVNRLAVSPREPELAAHRSGHR